MNIVTLAILLTPTVVHAAASEREPEQEARAYFDKGQQLVGKGKHLEALAAFSAGYELSHRAAFLFNMGECARLTGDVPRARELYRRYLAEDPYGKLAPTAQARLAELETAPKPAASPPPTPLAVTPAPVAPQPKPPALLPLSPSPSPSSPPLMEPRVTASLGAPVTPLWRKWPFWVGVGAVVVGGTVAALVATRGQGGDEAEANSDSLPDCGAGCQKLDWRL